MVWVVRTNWPHVASGIALEQTESLVNMPRAAIGPCRGRALKDGFMEAFTGSLNILYTALSASPPPSMSLLLILYSLHRQIWFDLQGPLALNSSPVAHSMQKKQFILYEWIRSEWTYFQQMDLLLSPAPLDYCCYSCQAFPPVMLNIGVFKCSSKQYAKGNNVKLLENIDWQYQREVECNMQVKAAFTLSFVSGVLNDKTIK